MPSRWIYSLLIGFIAPSYSQQLSWISELLTPSNSDPGNGARVLWNHQEVGVANNAWNIGINFQSSWQFIISLTNAWAFDSNRHSTLKITLDSPSISTGGNFDDILFGFTTDNQEYFSMAIPMDNNGFLNSIYPACDISDNPTQPLQSGDISPLPDNDRNCDIAGGTCSNWKVMQPQNTKANSFPITITLENNPIKNQLFVSFDSATANSHKQKCGFSPAFPTNQGLKMYIAGNEPGHQFVISSFLIEATTETMSPTVNPTTATPTQIPTISSQSPSMSPSYSPTSLSPTMAPSTSPTNYPTNIPTNAPSHSPVAPPTNAPTQTPSVAPTMAPSFSPSNAPTAKPSESPSNAPSMSPTKNPTPSPTINPTAAPTDIPSKTPTNAPSDSPTPAPSFSPIKAPTKSPTVPPTNAPTLSPVIPPTFAPTQPTMDPTERNSERVFAETLIANHQGLLLNIFAIFICFCCFSIVICFYLKRHNRSNDSTNDNDDEKDKTETNKEQEMTTLIDIARALSYHQETAKDTLNTNETMNELALALEIAKKKNKSKRKNKRKKKKRDRNKVRIRTFSMQSMDKYENYKNGKYKMENESDYSVIAQNETTGGMNVCKNEYGVDMLSFFNEGDKVQFNSDPDDDDYDVADRCQYGKVVAVDSNRGQITILRDDDGKKYTYFVGDIDVQPVQVMDTNETLLECEKDELSEDDSSDDSVCTGFEGEDKKAKSYKRIRYQLDAMLEEIDQTIN